ncbi:(Fe-S)-binding protein [Tropicimonas sp. TH_r6]|uniref:(Fe-S)-binding protein n=1 Tax=Tropicimonas sp. TH_r6 TaxID=3082085 RepID=UPI002954DBAD|nr:(Fe-S)-binding protein [Tropicimonas sp. TH_r6]MDV7145440.1 (Fe-S)-binding protein [Tropicimonas sp. TH_r6]
MGAHSRGNTLDFLKVANDLLPDGASYDACVGCGICASGCPASGLFGMDPRRFINMAMLGMNEELSTTPWVWACTQCKRCAYLCPMGIDVSQLVGAARGAWATEDKPKGIVRSCAAQKLDESTSAMGLMSEDFVEIVEETLEELHENQPRFADLKVPIDKKGAKFVINQNSREPAVEPEEMAPLWKILDYVGADWTYSSKGWAAENFCMFTGDTEAWKDMVETRVDAMNALESEIWINTECGHSFFTIWQGIEKFGLTANFEAESLVTYYAQWIREGKLPVNSDWNKNNVKFTVQDPCQLVRKSIGDQAAEDLRFVVKTLVGEENFVDMQPCRSANYCCGGGGGFLQAGMASERRAYGKRKFDQVIATEADYVLTPCHNCHSQIEDVGDHFGGAYTVTHLWTLICLSLGILGPDERKYLGPDLADINLPEEE